MGLLIEGKWLDQWYDTKSTGGKFERSIAQFRNWITKDGSAGPTGNVGFKAETGRYHLYASYACPWVHRVLIYRKLKGLENAIDVSFVHWYMAEQGWTFNKDEEGIVGDHLFDLEFAHQIYTMADKNYTGRVTVPILWDKDQNTIVSNESSEIIRMLNSAFVLKPWKKINFAERKIIILNELALSMGNYFFQGIDGGDEVKVEFTFGYVKDKDNNLLINLHHSSIPYTN